MRRDLLQRELEELEIKIDHAKRLYERFGEEYHRDHITLLERQRDALKSNLKHAKPIVYADPLSAILRDNKKAP